MYRPLVLPLALLAGACAPQNASIEVGDFTAWLSASNSITVTRGDALFGPDRDGDGVRDVLIDETPAEGNGSVDGYGSAMTIDCRPFETARNKKERDQLRLPGRLQICEDDRGYKPEVWPPRRETWLTQNGFYVVSDQLDPWRGEAIVTSEGDVQVGFHHRLPNGEDFRFAFVVDPNFQPRRCVQDKKTGGTRWEEVDGDWVENWSAGLPAGSRRFYLNASAYQFDPDQEPTQPERDKWFFPSEWGAGYAAGKFADDGFRVRSTRYADPAAYIAADSAGVEFVSVPLDALYFCDQPFVDRRCDEDEIAARRAKVNEAASDVERELRRAGVPEAAADLPSPRPIVEENLWRGEYDGVPAGLDGWMELNYSWVVFDPGSELEVGGSATGTFNIFFDATDSQSRFYVRGRFTVDRFKADTWVTDYLPERLLEQNGTTLCESE